LHAWQCLCICPARELARQLYEVITEMGKFTGIKVFLAVKDGVYYPPDPLFALYLACVAPFLCSWRKTLHVHGTNLVGVGW
jgi:hypothetical protein